MANPVVLQPGLLLVRPQYTVNPDTGDTPENILWFQSGTHTTPTLSNLAAMAAVFDPKWSAVHTVVSATTKQYLGSIWTDYSSTSGVSYTSVGTWSPASATGGNATPPNVAALISMSNGVRYRGGHFRIYLPWIGINLVSTTDSGNLIGTAPPALNSAFAAINAATTGSGVLGGQTQMLYAHRTNITKAQLYQIVSFQARLRLATQRRRLRKAPHK